MKDLLSPKERAEAAPAVLGDILGELGLSLSRSKTRIVCVAGGTEGFDFLGFHYRMVPARRNPRRRYLARWPSDKKMTQARSQMRELTGRNRRHVPTHKVVADLNDYLLG
jgi:RNA-directed DNA polymerase